MTETGEQAGGTASAEWDCEAYGPEGRQYGALCFFSEGARVCGSPGECSRRMTAERGRVFGVIRELAEAGDPVAEFLAGEFTSAGQLLGGLGDVERESPETEAAIASGKQDRLDRTEGLLSSVRLTAAVAALRVQLDAGAITRAAAVEQLTSRYDVTAAGAAGLLDGEPPAVSVRREPLAFYHNRSPEERETFRPIPTRPSAPPSRLGFRVFGDHGRHPAVGGHRFLAGGDDGAFGAAGTWCAVWVRTPDGPDQCGRPAGDHPLGELGAVSLTEAMRVAAEGRQRAARLECALDVVEFLRLLAPDEPAVPAWRPRPLAPLGGMPVLGVDTLPAGSWRMLDAAGEVLQEGELP